MASVDEGFALRASSLREFTALGYPAGADAGDARVRTTRWCVRGWRKKASLFARARIAEIERQLLTTEESRGSAPATFAELRRSERPYPLHGTLVRLPLKCAQL